MGLAQLALTDTAFPHRSPRGSACCRSCSPTTAAARCPRMAIHRDPGAPGRGPAARRDGGLQRAGGPVPRGPRAAGRARPVGPGARPLPPAVTGPYLHAHRLTSSPGSGLVAVRPDGYIGFSIGRADGDALRAGSRGLVRSNERRSSPETRLPADSGWPRRRDRGLQYPPIRSTGLMAEIGAAVRVGPRGIYSRLTCGNEPLRMPWNRRPTTWVKALQVQFLSAGR